MKTKEVSLPKCLTKDEFEALEYDSEVFYYSNSKSFVQVTIKGECIDDAYAENCYLSGLFLYRYEAETFKQLHKAGLLEFKNDTWVIAPASSPTPEQVVTATKEVLQAQIDVYLRVIQNVNLDIYGLSFCNSEIERLRNELESTTSIEKELK